MTGADPPIRLMPFGSASRQIDGMASTSEDQVMSDNSFSALSDALQSAVAAAAPVAAGIEWGGRGQVSAIAWRPGVLVTSEQSLPDSETYTAVLHGGRRVPATLAGRDPSTNLAVLRAEMDAPALTHGEPGGVGALVLAVGSDGAGGATARLGGIEVLGPAWESQRGGKIDRLMRVNVRIGPGAEGGPVIDARGALLGMSTFGPRRGVMVIPSATIARGVEQLLANGRMARGWLGVGLHPVELPADIAQRSGAESGLMVVSFADAAPASGVLLPGDIILAIGQTSVSHPRAVAGLFGPETVGTAMRLSLVRGGVVMDVTVTIGARPA